MSAPDNEAHTPLEWAADAGDVNVMEFFMRKGLSPFRQDSANRTALFWAVKVSSVSVCVMVSREMFTKQNL
jgi:ankyrin repeat protein